MSPRQAAFAIIDTNVVVSGLLTFEEAAPTSRILDGMLGGVFRFLLSEDLLAEYRAVLLRPKIRDLHGLSEEEVDQLLTEVTANAVVRKPTDADLEPPDQKDRHLWQLLGANTDSILVTGDRRLRESSHYIDRVSSPREFVDSLPR